MFCIFCLFYSVYVPKYSLIFVSSNRQYEFENYVELLNENKNKLCEQTNFDDISYCKALYETMQIAKAATGFNVNDKIKEITKSSEFLFILCDDVYETIDFNNLKKEMVTFLSYEPDMYYDYGINNLDTNHFENFTKNIIRAIQRATHIVNNKDSQSFSYLCEQIVGPIEKDKKIKIDEVLKVPIEGNIKGKVSFLTVSNIMLNIVNNDLNCNSLYMNNAIFNPDSLLVKTKFFVTNPVLTTTTTLDKVRAEQYGYLMIDSVFSRHTIQFTDDSYCVASTNYGLINGVCYPAPKICGKTFNWIVYGRKFELYATESIGENELNISFMNEYSRPSLQSYTYYDAIFSTRGYWDSIEKKPKITLNYDKDMYNIDVTELDELGFIIDEERPYSYSPLNKEQSGPNQKVIGIICGVIFVVILTVILIVIAILYRPKKENSIEEKMNEGVDEI